MPRFTIQLQKKTGKAFDTVYGIEGTSWQAGSLGFQQDGSALETTIVNELASRGPTVVELTFDSVAIKVFYPTPSAKVDDVEFSHCINRNGTTIVNFPLVNT